jgi:hypothetical protein
MIRDQTRQSQRNAGAGERATCGWMPMPKRLTMLLGCMALAACVSGEIAQAPSGASVNVSRDGREIMDLCYGHVMGRQTDFNSLVSRGYGVSKNSKRMIYTTSNQLMKWEPNIELWTNLPGRSPYCAMTIGHISIQDAANIFNSFQNRLQADGFTYVEQRAGLFKFGTFVKGSMRLRVEGTAGSSLFEMYVGHERD